MLLPQDTVDKYNALPKKWRSEVLEKVRLGQNTRYNTRINLIMQRKEHPTPDEEELIIPIVDKYYTRRFGVESEQLESKPLEQDLRKTGGTLPIPLG